MYFTFKHIYRTPQNEESKSIETELGLRDHNQKNRAWTKSQKNHEARFSDWTHEQFMNFS